MLFSHFYFDDSLLMELTRRLPAHLGAGEMRRNQNIIGQKSVEIKKKSEQKNIEVQSNKYLSVDHENSIFVPLAMGLTHHSNRSVIKESINSVIKLDKVLSDRKDTLIQRDRNRISMNGNKALNSAMNNNATDDVGHATNYDSNTNSYHFMNAGPKGLKKHVKGDPLNNSSSNYAHSTRQSRGMSSHNNQQQTKHSPDNNYLLSSPCSDPLCTSFLSERDLGNFWNHYL